MRLNAETKYGRLRKRILEQYDSLMNFSVMTDIPYERVMRLLNGEEGFSSEEIADWCNALELGEDDIEHYFFQQKTPASGSLEGYLHSLNAEMQENIDELEVLLSDTSSALEKLFGMTWDDEEGHVINDIMIRVTMAHSKVAEIAEISLSELTFELELVKTAEAL